MNFRGIAAVLFAANLLGAGFLAAQSPVPPSRRPNTAVKPGVVEQQPSDTAQPKPKGVAQVQPKIPPRPLPPGAIRALLRQSPLLLQDSSKSRLSAEEYGRRAEAILLRGPDSVRILRERRDINNPDALRRYYANVKSWSYMMENAQSDRIRVIVESVPSGLEVKILRMSEE